MDEDCKDTGELNRLRFAVCGLQFAVYSVLFIAWSLYLTIKTIIYFVATIKRFEDLESWQLARQLAKAIKQLTMQDNFTHEFKLKEQIKSSSGSVMDNIAEGFGREAGWNLCSSSQLPKVHQMK